MIQAKTGTGGMIEAWTGIIETIAGIEVIEARVETEIMTIETDRNDKDNSRTRTNITKNRDRRHDNRHITTLQTHANTHFSFVLVSSYLIPDRYTFLDCPKEESIVPDPMPNSSRFVLPTSTAPAPRRRSTTVAE